MLPAVPVLGFMAYLKQIHGSWFAWQEAQEKGWAREFTWPWTSLVHTVEAATQGPLPGRPQPTGPGCSGPNWSPCSSDSRCSCGCSGAGRGARPPGWASTIAAFVTSYWVYSLTRATLLWWPLWIGLAVLANRRPWLVRLYLAVAIPLAAIWAAAFFTGRWTG